jgi:hypothetical protein
VNPLLLLAIIIALIAISLVACVRALMETGLRRLLWTGVVLAVVVATLGSLAIGT